MLTERTERIVFAQVRYDRFTAAVCGAERRGHAVERTFNGESVFRKNRTYLVRGIIFVKVDLRVIPN